MVWDHYLTESVRDRRLRYREDSDFKDTFILRTSDQLKIDPNRVLDKNGSFEKITHSNQFISQKSGEVHSPGTV